MTHLFIFSHIDDCELSCAGLITKLVSKGEHVKVISMSHKYNGSDLKDEFVKSMDVLMVRDRQLFGMETRRFNAFENVISDIVYEKVQGYDYVYTHDVSDRHPDHSILARQVKRLYNGSLITSIFPWNGTEDPNYFVEISEAQLENKIQALKCYKSQSRRPYMDEEFIRSWARYNGIKCGKLYAEAFKIERLINIGM
jgi:LmbE family N-acetylglucosaminyl deacetylase